MSWKNVPAAWSRAQSRCDEQLDEGRIQDLIRDAHTIKGSAGLLGYDEIKEVASRLEHLWKQIGEGYRPPGDVVVAMEASAGRLLPSLDVDDDELAARGQADPGGVGGVTPGHRLVTTGRGDPCAGPSRGSLGGLLTSVSDSLLGVRPVSTPASSTG